MPAVLTTDIAGGPGTVARPDPLRPRLVEEDAGLPVQDETVDAEFLDALLRYDGAKRREYAALVFGRIEEAERLGKEREAASEDAHQIREREAHRFLFALRCVIELNPGAIGIHMARLRMETLEKLVNERLEPVRQAFKKLRDEVKELRKELASRG